MSKHTPGPWAVGARRGDDWDSVIYLPDAPHLEICQCFHDPQDTDVCTANAHLIAAAPIMYEALERLVADYQDVPDATDREGQLPFEQARAAIAKARGEER